MAIKINTEKRIFTLETKHTMYQMQADTYGVLRHLWYGAKTGCDMSYLQDYPDVGFSGNPHDAGNDRTYSLDTLPLEYAGAGIGDFRVPAVEAVHADGSCALDLRYYSHTVKQGKYAIAGLPALYAGEDEAETLEVVLRDTASAVEVTLKYGVLPELDIVTRCAEIRNLGEAPVTLTKGGKPLSGHGTGQLGVDTLLRQTRHGTAGRTPSAAPRHSGEFQHPRHVQPSPESHRAALYTRLHGNLRCLRGGGSGLQRQPPDQDRVRPAGAGACSHGNPP